VIPRASRAGQFRQRCLEDPEWAEQYRKRRRERHLRLRQNPAYRERENETKRARTRAARVAAGFDPDVPIATARKQKRRAEIVALLNEKGFVSVGELVERYGMNPKRVADDLRHLHDEGLALRVYGGAKMVESTSNHVGAARQ